MKLLKPISIVFLGLFVVVAACTDDADYVEDREDRTEMKNDDTMHQDDMNRDNMMKTNTAVAVVNPTQDSNVEGWVTFTKEGDGVRVNGEFSGLSEGKHGFHIHQYGDCRAADATSAGGHFNPAGNDHGARTDSVRHMGDMGNITAGSNGNATVDYLDSVIKMKHIIGRGLVIHGGEDDLTSQPSGAAGPRMACGVIGIANTDAGMNEGTNNMENENM